MEIHNKDIISFRNFLSTKQGHKSKQMKTKTFFLVVALKGLFGMS